MKLFVIELQLSWEICYNYRLYTLVENSEDSISTDDLELIRYLHVPVDGLICLFEGLLILKLLFFASIFLML